MRRKKEIDERPSQYKFIYHRNKQNPDGEFDQESTERFIQANNLEQAWKAFHYVISKDPLIEDIHVNAIYKYDEYKPEGKQWDEVFINDLNP
jgi:hypothetical protein